MEPNLDEWRELEQNCTWEQTVEDDVNGYRVTGPSGKSIFLPLRGYLYSSIKGVDAITLSGTTIGMRT